MTTLSIFALGWCLYSLHAPWWVWVIFGIGAVIDNFRSE